MKKQLSAIFILAGTALGSGMISLPIVLSHIGMVPTLLLIILCSIITYISALIRVELNICSNCNFTLEDVALKFSGETAALIGNISLKLLSFSLLSAYIYGLSSIISDGSIKAKIIIAVSIFMLLVFSSHRIIKFNKQLFVMLLIAVFGSIIAMMFNVDFKTLPQNHHIIQISKCCIILLTLFTSFGFQGSLHSLTKFCDNDRNLIKNACLYGSIIPAIIYIAWTFGVMSLTFNSQPELFLKMASQGIDIDELIMALSNISNATFIKSSVFVISLLAILTSIIGVGIALIEDLEMITERNQIHVGEKARRYICSAIAIIPSVLIAIIVPKAFVQVLSFAGMILSVIAIFLPSFLLFKISKKVEFKPLKRKTLTFSVIIFGISIVICEILSLINIK